MSTLLGAVVTGGVGVVLYAFVTEGLVGMAGPRPLLYLAFLALLVAAECRPIMWLRREEGAVVTIALAFDAALLFLTPGLGAAVGAGLASAIGDLVSGRGTLKVAFNASMMTLSVALAHSVMVLAGDRLLLLGDQPLTVAWFVTSSLALVVMFFTNGVLVCWIVALNEGTPVLHTIKRDILHNASTDGMLLLLGPVLIVVAQRSLLLLPAVLTVILLVLRTTRMALDRLHEATHDSLTGLPNRRLFDEHLEALVDHRGPDRAAVILLDLDGFKEINDTLGHDVGDDVLRAVAARLKSAVPASAMVARLGGDEFATVITNPPDDDALVAIGQRVHRALQDSRGVDAMPIRITGSIGIARDRGEQSSQRLLRCADVAMYAAKRDGSGVHLSSKDDAGEASGRMELMEDLREAIAHGGLFCEFQPITDLRTGAVHHAEALVRWNHPTRGRVSPAAFIPTAEHTDLIGPLTEVVLRESLAACRQWRDDGHVISVAVNLSALTLQDLSFSRLIETMLAEAGLPASALVLEITENTVLGDEGRVVRVLDSLRSLGIQLAIDDFGTGFSSLTSLRNLPTDIVKIDHSFVRHMATQPEDAAIVAAVIAMAAQMGLHTIAEGVENEAILQSLVDLGCDAGQGFHLGLPMAAPDMLAWLDEQAELNVTFARMTA